MLDSNTEDHICFESADMMHSFQRTGSNLVDVIKRLVHATNEARTTHREVLTRVKDVEENSTARMDAFLARTRTPTPEKDKGLDPGVMEDVFLQLSQFSSRLDSVEGQLQAERKRSATLAEENASLNDKMNGFASQNASFTAQLEGLQTEAARRDDQLFQATDDILVASQDVKKMATTLNDAEVRAAQDRTTLTQILEVFGIDVRAMGVSVLEHSGLEYLKTLPLFESILKEQTQQKQDLMKSVEAVKESLLDDIVVTRSRIIDKADKAAVDRLGSELMAQIDTLLDTTKHLDTMSARLFEEKADACVVEPRLQALEASKATRAELEKKLDASDVTVFKTQIEVLHSDLSDAWARIESLASTQTQNHARRITRGSIHQDDKHDKQHGTASSVSHNINLESLKLRLADAERLQGANTEKILRLFEIKLDRDAMKDIYTFLDKVTRRVDQMGTNLTDVNKFVSSVKGDSSVEPVSSVNLIAPNPPKNRGSAASARSSPSASPVPPAQEHLPTLSSDGAAVVGPKVEKMDKPRQASPGNSRWSSGGACFVRTASGAFTPASITSC